MLRITALVGIALTANDAAADPCVRDGGGRCEPAIILPQDRDFDSIHFLTSSLKEATWFKFSASMGQVFDEVNTSKKRLVQASLLSRAGRSFDKSGRCKNIFSTRQNDECFIIR